MKEKKMRKEEIEKKIKEEYKRGRKFCKLDNRFCYQMMIDTSDGVIWVDVFTDNNSYNNYQSNSIVPLQTVQDNVKDMEKEYITLASNLLINAGWTIL